MIITAFDGLCMALADSVPGVSGGTIAFILGFYDRLIGALHNLFGKERAARKTAIIYLIKLGIGWCLGMGICIVLLSSLFTKNIYFMSSLFLGLTAASIPFILRSEKANIKGKFQYLFFTLIGILAVVGLTLLRSGDGIIGKIDFLDLQSFQYLYLLDVGMLAIIAMILPGISGSTVLLIAGVYVPAISAAKQLLSLNIAVLPGLITLGFGVLLGVGVSIHSIRAAMKKHRSQMVYLILGLILGSLFAIVMGPTTLAEPVPALSFSTFDFFSFAIGVAVLFGLELLKKTMSGKNPANSTAEGDDDDEH